MRILVFGGSGTIGSAVAWDLARDPDVEAVGLLGRHRDALEAVRDWIGSDKVDLHVAGIDEREALLTLMVRYDAAALALPERRSSYAAVELAIEAGLPVVDMLEEYHRTPDPYEVEGLAVPPGMTPAGYGDWLHERAMARAVTFLDGMGFAPGLANVTLGEGIRTLDTAETAVARVGGIPSRAAAERHPLRYMITWAFEHVLREYTIPLKVIRGGRVVEVAAGSDREAFRFDALGHDELLECAVTPGMPSFITSRPQLAEFSEKTVRWPGHWAGVETLKECGLLGLDPVTVDGAEVVPRHLLLALVAPHLVPLPGDTDVCVMYNTLEGTKDGRRVRLEWRMWDEADTGTGLSSMRRVTGFPVAVAARMLARGEIRGTGIVPPEDGIRGDLYTEFLAQLARRGIRIEERLVELTPAG